MKQLKALARRTRLPLAALAILGVAGAIQTQAALPTVTEFTGLVADGTTIFEAVAVLLLAVIGFAFMRRMLKGRG